MLPALRCRRRAQDAVGRLERRQVGMNFARIEHFRILIEVVDRSDESIPRRLRVALEIIPKAAKVWRWRRFPSALDSGQCVR
jgi:hypothetical protein